MPVGIVASQPLARVAHRGQERPADHAEGECAARAEDRGHRMAVSLPPDRGDALAERRVGQAERRRDLGPGMTCQ